MKKLVALGGMLVVVSSFAIDAQTVVPNPPQGTVLWKLSVSDIGSHAAPALDANGILWGIGDQPPYKPKGFNTRTVQPIASTLPPFSFPELRLRTEAAFLLDGSAITYADVGDGANARLSALGTHPWTTAKLSGLGTGLVAANGTYLFPYAPGRLAALDGEGGDFTFDRNWSVLPPSFMLGFGFGGLLITIGIDGERFFLSTFDTDTGARRADLPIPDTIRPINLQSPRHRLNNYLVVTEEGLIAIAAFRYPPGQTGPAECGVWIVNPAHPLEQRFVRLGREYPNVTGLVAARNGLVFASLYEPVSGYPWKLGGVRGIDPKTGSILVSPDIQDGVAGPPVIGPDGTLYVLTEPPAFPQGFGAVLYAVATGSKGGLARSPWPRSTGDNLNSFREQGVDDGDGDGLTDEQETLNYRTNPRLADTDGDGYSDGVEAQNGSDPLNKSNIPEILEAQVAIKLSFGTNLGHRYRLQSSLDLVGWTNEGEPFEGTGSKSTQLVEASRARFYWRLVRVD